ncbi:MAG: lysophospholipid acyltransferase family protein [Bacteroidales bacterium]|nr:lysophospholipid acyltransferase family protein [Bacteroidales bacterium]
MTRTDRLKLILLRLLVQAVACLPFRVLYVLSDGARYLLYYIVRYRRRVVEANVAKAFPTHSAAEQQTIVWDFYRFFGDYTIETLKLARMRPEEMRERMHMQGIEDIEKAFETHDFVFLMLGHYANWEWVSSFGLWANDAHVQASQIYRPLNDKAVDTLFYELRTRFGSHNINKYDVVRSLLRLRRSGKKVVCGFISDQSPSMRSTHAWVDFLHQETAIFTGAERIGQKLNAAYYFVDIERTSRGHYRVTYRPIFSPITSDTDYPITRQYMALLETMINRQPSLWLWSHRRWKFTRQQWQAELAREA